MKIPSLLTFILVIQALPPLVLIDTTFSSYEPGPLDYNKTYYWRVVAKDGRSGQADTGVLSFTTMHQPGTLKWYYQTGDAIWWGMSPTIDDGNIYFGSNDGKIYSLTPDGVKRWIYSTGLSVKSAPTIVDNYVIVGNLGGRMMVFNKDTGALVKQFIVSGDLWGVSVAVDEDTIYFGGGHYDTKFYAYSFSNLHLP